MADPISRLLVLLAMVISAMTVAVVRDLLSSEACARETEGLLMLCQGGPAFLRVVVTGMLALVAWCRVGMRATRLSH
jgi:hypothetical protein